MERLTNKREADAQREGYERRLANGYQRSIPVERFLRLAAYEDTDYTPEEIAKLQGELIQRNAELLKTREELKGHYDSISQLDGANSSLMAANEKLAADRKALINELCQYCGKYKQAHEGACDGCRWREM
mgnify:CR=1 FL=1